MSIKWTSDLSVGVEEIDNQHKLFLETLNEYYELINKGADNIKIRDIVSKLENFAITHFATEEKYFDMFSYELSEPHKKVHDMMKEKILEFKNRLINNEDILFELGDYLEDWFVGHLSDYDKKYIKCFKENGLK